MSIVSLTEEQVTDLLDWDLVSDAVEQALRSVCEHRVNDEQPSSNQPARTFTPSKKGVLLSMPAFINNYKLTSVSKDQSKVFDSLGCKLVTSFSKNSFLDPPKPNIMANIFLFNENTGELKAMLQAGEITAWRTAAASIVATKYLYSARSSSPKINTLAILGCGVQGRIHAIGLCAMNSITTVYLWNRTKSRAECLAAELNQLRQSFKNPNVNIICVDTVQQSVQDANVIVTATFSRTPILCRSWIKTDVHINAVGAGENHHSELNNDIYNDVETKIYVDSNVAAQVELKTLNAPIVGEVGDIINGRRSTPSNGISIFHSMGMAVEDVAVGQALLEKFQNNTK